MTIKTSRRVFLAISGASGAACSQKLIEELYPRVDRLYLTATETGKRVLQTELAGPPRNLDLRKLVRGEVADFEKIRLFENDNFYAPIASGSSAATDMLIVPCSMGMIGRISSGLGSTLIERAADVMIKEKKPLILFPRESPLSPIHLENMLKLSQCGAMIVPPMPGFYTQPKTFEDVINFLVGRLLEHLGYDHDLYPRWSAHNA